MSKRIRVGIDQLGKATVEAEGFSGTACEAATSAIEAALGGDTTVEHKPEFYETGQEQETVATW